jgi:hypothetical protein
MRTKKKTKSRSKAVYHVRNWSEYDRALVNRYSLTLWISKDMKKACNFDGQTRRGAQFQYSDLAIESMLMFKEIFHLTNRGVEGFVRSLFELMKINLSVPDHTTLSERGKHLEIELPRQAQGPMQIVMDSTGLKVYGEGEWKVRKHGWNKRRTWCKLHLMIDPISGEIQAVDLTGANGHDSKSVGPMLAQLEPSVEIETIAGDGGYDTWEVYDVIKVRGPTTKIMIPPQKNAKIKQHGNCKAPPLPRDETLRAIRKSSRKNWKNESGYHQRSLAETAMFRFKTIFDDQLSTRSLEAQTVQVRIRCKALNRMTRLGMPQSYKVP